MNRNKVIAAFSFPPVVCYLGVEVQGGGPSEHSADALDVGQHGGMDRAVAAMIFVIGGATAVADKRVLDGPFGVAGHVVIEVFHAYGHRQRLVVAEVFTAAVLCLAITGRDAGGDVQFWVDVLAHFPAQTIRVAWALVAEAAKVGGCLFAK